MVSVKNFHHPGDLDPYPATDALNRYTLIRDEPLWQCYWLFTKESG